MFKSTAITFLTTVSMIAMGFFTSIVTARLLGPEGRGLFSASLLIGTLAGQIAQFGLAPSYVYHAGAGMAFNYPRFLILSLLTVTATAAAFSAIGLHLNGGQQLLQAWPLVVLFAVFSGHQSYFFVLTQIHPNLHFLNSLRISVMIGNLLLLVVLAIWVRPVDFEQVLATQTLVLALVSGAAIAWALRHRIWKVDLRAERAKLRNVLSYALNLYGAGLLTLVAANFDKVVLLKLGTVTQFGFYALAFGTSRLIGPVQDALSTNLFARFAGKDIGELDRSVRTSFRITFLPLLLLAALGAATSPWSIKFIYGGDFQPVIVPFSILLFECVITGAAGTLAQRFNAAGSPGLMFVRQLISLVPLAAALPFLTIDNALLALPLLMLLGAIIRLVMTLALYPFILREPLPLFLPTFADFRKAANMVSKGWERLMPYFATPRPSTKAE
jgi:antigen flippase